MTRGPIDHVGIVVRSIADALPRYAQLLGLMPDAEPVSLLGDRVRLAFLPTGLGSAARIELVEPLANEGGVARFLAEHGEGLHHVCFASTDLRADMAVLTLHGAELIDTEPRAGAHGLIAFVHPRTLSSVLWELQQEKP